MSRLTQRELDLIRRQRPAAEREAGPKAAAGLLAATVIEPIRRSLRRRRTIAELSRLDDRMLQDIGLNRGSLESFADEMIGRDRPAPHGGGVLDMLRRWRRRQATIQQLASLDDRVLQDIGILRGDIPGTVDRAMRAEEAAQAAPRGVDSLLREIRASLAQAQQPAAGDSAALHAKAMAAHALQVASRRQAS